MKAVKMGVLSNRWGGGGRVGGRNFPQFSAIYSNLSAPFPQLLLLVPLVCRLVPGVSPVQRCCSLRLRGVCLQHRNLPAIFRNFSQLDLTLPDRTPPPPLDQSHVALACALPPPLPPPSVSCPQAPAPGTQRCRQGSKGPEGIPVPKHGSIAAEPLHAEAPRPTTSPCRGGADAEEPMDDHAEECIVRVGYAIRERQGWGHCKCQGESGFQLFWGGIQ